MNNWLNLLGWLEDHATHIWASLATMYIGIEKCGGLRTIWSNILGPKQPQAEVVKEEVKQDK